MLRLTFYLCVFLVFSLFLFATDIAPNWFHTFMGLYLFIAVSFITFSIGFELGLRAPTNSESLFSYKDPLSVRLRKLFIDLSSLGFSKRRHKLDNDGLPAKPSQRTERNKI